MSFGAFQRSRSYRQLWRRSATRTPPLGRGAASLVLGSDAEDETTQLEPGDEIVVSTTGDVNDSKALQVRGVVRLNEVPPVGYAWRVFVDVAGVETSVLLTHTDLAALVFPWEASLSDLAPNLTGLGAGVAIGLGLAFETDPAAPGPAARVDVTLPSVYVDQLLAPETLVSALYVHARNPAPFAESVPTTLPSIAFTLADTTGAGVDLANTVVTIDGVVAYLAGAFTTGWTGTVTVGAGPDARDVEFVVDLPAFMLPLTSEQVVEINVISQLVGPASPISESWSFIAADTTTPALQSATMINGTTLRVVFTDDVLLDASAGGALNPANYAVTRVSAPAVSVEVVAASAVFNRTDAVDLTLDVEASQGATYMLLAKAVLDDGGNVIDPEGSEVRFAGYVCPRPAGRRFELLDFIPDFNVAEDRTAAQGGDPTNPGTGDLRKFILVLQDVVDLLLCSVDRWTDIIDVDLAPEPFLDAMLQDLGNPFADCIADLDVNDKRRLARVLISIYKQKGTGRGIVNAVRFFLGLEVTLDVINARQFWQLDVSQLGVDTILAPPVGSPLWYSFWIVSPIVLTQTQRDRILCLAQYMRGAHEHVLGIIEPGTTTLNTYWTLNVSALGTQTLLA